MSDTPRLSLPLIEPAQAQKHVTHNEALVKLDALAGLSVASRTLTDPPGGAADGEAYLVAAPAGGAWAGAEGEIAYRIDGAWRFYAAFDGLVAHVADEAALIVHAGGGWVDYASLLAWQNLPLLGVGTTADPVNPLAAKLPNVLLSATTAAEGGDGSLRLKANKEAPADTVSLLFQTGYAGRAELGLVGDDALTLRVSADGAAWSEALRVAQDSGKVSFPQGIDGGRERLSGNRNYYVDAATGDDGYDGLSPGTAFASLQKAYDVIVATLDLAGHTVTVQVADGSYPDGVTLADAWTGGGGLVFLGNQTTPANVQVAAAGTAVRVLGVLPGSFALRGMMLSSAAGHGLSVENVGLVGLADVHFGACALYQMQATVAGAAILVTTDYTIAGGAQAHMHALYGGRIVCNGRTVTLTATPDFATAFLFSWRLSSIGYAGNSFAGTATGVRFNVSTNSGIFVAGASDTYLPGDTAGAQATGGVYI